MNFRPAKPQPKWRNGLLWKVSGTHRYVVTEGGRKINAAVRAARQADIEQLGALAAWEKRHCH